MRQPEPSGGRGYRFNAALFGLPLVDEIMDDAEDVEQLLHGRRIVCRVAVPDPARIGGRMDGAFKQGYPAPHFLEERIDRVQAGLVVKPALLLSGGLSPHDLHFNNVRLFPPPDSV